MEATDLKTASFWQNNESYCSLNPLLELSLQQKIQDEVKMSQQEGCLWVKSSGTESSKLGEHKIVCISKKSFLAAAQSVVKTYSVTSEDHILNPLPLFHVGGIATYARSYLSGAKVSQLSSWKVSEFKKVLEQQKITITSLVPTQIFDLVENKIQSPEILRLVFVGGGALSNELYKKARELSWPLVLTYGMTETSAMIAGSSLNDSTGKMKLMDHVELIPVGNRWSIESECLFKGYLFVGDNKSYWIDRPNPFLVDDNLEVNGQWVRVLARESELVKILGETVNLVELAKRYQQTLGLKVEPILVAMDDARKGYSLKLYIEGEKRAIDLDSLNESFLGFERVSEISFVKTFPKNEMGKVLKHQLN